jgi:SAM-dependent methyltransferase
MSSAPATQDASYAERLESLESAWWKRALDVQRPYRWNLRRLDLGFVLDVGCGLGRNLVNLGGRNAGVGVDHSAEAVARARSRGLVAFLPDEFRASDYAVSGRFDSMLVAHVAEHMSFGEAQELVRSYLPYLRPGGRLVLMTPQEAGFRSDPTHVEYLDLDGLARLARSLELEPDRAYSFPFPRAAGRLFKHNEFVLVARRPSVPPQPSAVSNSSRSGTSTFLSRAR